MAKNGAFNILELLTKWLGLVANWAQAILIIQGSETYAGLYEPDGIHVGKDFLSGMDENDDS